ncbi:putative endoplasmic reticulum DnaJ domain protein Erj5 [Phyllosticta citrichinensis]|uniref:Endoplasmic reticulum DnaJ domain protein Erj5 n=1 Tax=Phyllosticta citrichinensis TaxID=1130410 RepID=A0ABR1Y4N6_9PEZI
MKLSTLATVLLCTFVSLVAAWSKEDHEIFRLRDEVIAAEGPDATFYSFLGVSPAATQDQINKAYRKKSRQIHPDKARQAYIATYAKPDPKSKSKDKTKKKPGVTVRKQPTAKELKAFDKEASARFARLGIVANILRGQGRERYDHFLKNGFPAWRGTGYYYSRFRPGLGSVMVGLFVSMGGAAHYGALYLGWKRQREFVERYIRHARRMAWGDELGIQGLPGGLGVEGVTTSSPEAGAGSEEEKQYVDENGKPVVMNRKQKRAQEKLEKKEAAKKGEKNAKVANMAKNGGVSTPVEAELTSGGPQGARKRVQAENGKVLIVDSAGNVFLEETTDEGEAHEFLLDVGEIPKPTFRDTAVVRLPAWVYNKSLGRLFGSSQHAAVDHDVHVDVDGSEDGEVYANGDAKDSVDILKSAASANPNAEIRKRRAKRNK